jgi:hypothetical protein
MEAKGSEANRQKDKRRLIRPPNSSQITFPCFFPDWAGLQTRLDSRFAALSVKLGNHGAGFVGIAVGKASRPCVWLTP